MSVQCAIRTVRVLPCAAIPVMMIMTAAALPAATAHEELITASVRLLPAVITTNAAILMDAELLHLLGRDTMIIPHLAVHTMSRMISGALLPATTTTHMHHPRDPTAVLHEALHLHGAITLAMIAVLTGSSSLPARFLQLYVLFTHC